MSSTPRRAPEKAAKVVTVAKPAEVANRADGAAKARRAPVVRTPSHDVRTALVDATEAVLVREGAAAITVRAVAAEARVAPMSVYNRFGSKDGLIEALLIRGFEGLRDAVAAQGELDPRVRLREAGIRYRDFAVAHAAVYELMFGARPPGDVSSELTDCAKGAFGELVGHVSTAMAAGALMAGDPQQVAQQIWSGVHGAVILEIGGRIEAEVAEANFLGVLDLSLRGLSAPP